MSVTIIDPKQYQLGENYPAPYLPPSIQEELTKAGGLNPNGEPNFRVVWGCSEQHYRMNGWRMKYIVGVQHHWTEHKTKGGIYVKQANRVEIGTPRWIIEAWQPPEFFGTPEYWDSVRFEMIDGVMFDKIGEFPNRGDYRHYLTIQDDDGEYKLPDESDMAFMRESIWLAKHTKPNPEQETRDTVAAQKEFREKQENEFGQELAELGKLHGQRVENPYRWKRGGSGNTVFHDSNKQFTGANSASGTTE